jgi:hypothetical protein
MLLTMEAALDATLVGAFDGAFDAGAGGEGDELRSLRLLLLCSLCELCFEDEVWEDLAFDLPELLLSSSSARSATNDEMKELGAALCAFETTLWGLDDGRGGLDVVAVETVLLALSIISNSGLVLERWAAVSLEGALDGAVEYAGAYSIASGSAICVRGASNWDGE